MIARSLLSCLIFAFAGTVATHGADFRPSPPTEPKCRIPTFEAEYVYSEAVFVGEVIEESKEGDKRLLVFEIRRFWKGVGAKKLRLSVIENMRFQALFEKGKTYLVFAKKNEDDGGLFDGRCSRSSEIGGDSSTLEDDLEKLGDAKTCISLEETGGEIEDNA